MKVLQNAKSKVDGCLIGAMVVASQVLPAFAKDIFDVGEQMGSAVYEKIRTISTPICAALIVISLLVSHFGGEKATDAGRKAAFGVIITWCIINGLGYIMTFIVNSGGFGEDATWTSHIVNTLSMMV